MSLINIYIFFITRDVGVMLIEFAFHYNRLGIGYSADKMEHAECVCQCCLGIGT